MKKYELLWYDLNEVKKKDIVEAESAEEAERKGYLKYNGNPPAPQLTVMEVGGSNEH